MIIAQTLFVEIIRDAVAPFLKSKGYKKRHLYFYKQAHDMNYNISFQNSVYNSYKRVTVYVNCGIYANALEKWVGNPIIDFPKSYESLFEQRFENLTGYSKQAFEVTLTTDKALLSQEIVENLQKVIDFYEKVPHLDALMDVCIERNFLRDSTKIFTYLKFQNDVERIALYKEIIRKQFQNDNRLPFIESNMKAF